LEHDRVRQHDDCTKTCETDAGRLVPGACPGWHDALGSQVGRPKRRVPRHRGATRDRWGCGLVHAP
jgi:hypothetical protein